MSQHQITLLTLEKINYSGANVGNTFNISFTADTESNSLSLTLARGVDTLMTENLGGLDIDPANAPFTMPVTVHVAGTFLGQPVSGNGTMNLVIQAVPSEQTYIMPVNVSPPIGGAATFTFYYRVRYREYPVSYNPEWLCRNRYNWSAFQRWLCLGNQQLVDFNTQPAILDMTQTFADYTGRLQRISDERSLGFTPAGAGFFDRQAFTFNVVMGVALSVSTLHWGRWYTVDDFADTIEGHMETYMVAVHPQLDLQVIELCQRWRELLDCFCRFCMLRDSLPNDAVSFYDATVAPQVESMYTVVSSIATAQAMPASLAPLAPAVNCDKLRYIVSFWAWYCRQCPPFDVAGVTAQVEPFYPPMYDARALLNDILEANSMTLCNPPEKDFCTRWQALLNCLVKLCNVRAGLPTALVNDIESTFGTAIRGVATFLNLPGIAPLLSAGIANTCALLAKLKAYIDSLCPPGAVPGTHVRRNQLDTTLVQLETAMAGFKTRNGDLCVSGVPMTGCTDWQPILHCLVHLCTEKNLFTTALRSAILSDFGTVIDDLLAIAYTTPPAPPPGATGIDLLCFKISSLSSFFDSLCPNHPIDPVTKLRLELKLAALQSAYNTFVASYPNICSTSVTVPTTTCDSWHDIIACLQRICRRSKVLNSEILDDVASGFGAVMDEIMWVVGGGAGTYQADPLTFPAICEALDRLKDFIDTICAEGVDPVVKLRLDALLATLQTKYSTLLADYPGICVEPDTFCDQWIEVLDCLGRLGTRLAEAPGDPIATNTLTLASEGMGTAMSDSYLVVFGESTPGTFDTPVDRLLYQTGTLTDWFREHCACCGGTVSSTIRTNLAAKLTEINDAYHELVACEPSCITTELSLTTGADEVKWIVTRIDDVELDVPRDAHVVTGTGGIGTPIAGSQWISGHATADDDTEGVTTFKRCFCVCTPGTVHVQITYLADDTADIYLDDQTVHLSPKQIMGVAESETITLTVTAGRHCIRVEATNKPADNMAFCATGSITAGTATLLDDDCCGKSGESPGPCRDVAVPCDRIIMLPRMYRFLCCPARPDGDALYSTQAYTNIVNALTCFEAQIGMILIAAGRLPGEVPLVGSGFCARMRRASRVLLIAYLNYRTLTPLVRYLVDCFYDLLRRSVSDLVDIESDNPLPCTDACAVCTRWLDLLACVCRMCMLRPSLAEDHPSLAALITGTFCGEGDFCCESLMYSYSDLLENCFCCTGLEQELAGFDDAYDWLYAQYQTLADAFTAAGLTPCNPCERWRDMLACLANVCLRRHELSEPLQASFETLFATRVGAVATAVFGFGPTPSPFAADVFGNTCWTIVRLVQQFDWLCTGFAIWEPGVEDALASLIVDFTQACATFTGQLNTAGMPICTQPVDPCERLRRLADAYRTICETPPNPGAAPIAAISTAMSRLAQYCLSIQKQLGVSVVIYPSNASFCDRLYFLMKIAASVYARYDALRVRHRIFVDLFDAIVRRQGEIYSWSIANEMPRPATEMSEYRTQWMELLTCICRACEWVRGLNTGQRATYSAIVTMVEGPAGNLASSINDLYTRVLNRAQAASLPIVTDPCADTPCKRLLTVMDFFTMYCLRCAAPEAAVVTALESALDPLRTATVALRAALVNAGVYLCPEENQDVALIQSPELYLQAAGSTSSTGADGSAPGVHLRWALVDDLAKHLPKGNLARPGTTYHGNNPLNRADDFVRVRRAPYGPSQRFAAVIDLTATPPSLIEGSYDDGVIWTFNDVRYDPAFNDTVTTVRISFPPGVYTWGIPAQAQYLSHVGTVLSQYTGVYRVEAVTKLMFALEVDVAGAHGQSSVQFEAISRNDDPAVDDPNFVSARIQINGAINPHRIESESIEYALFKCVNCRPAVIRVETFEDFYAGSKRHYLWKQLGQYALSLDDTEVYRRLEDPGKYDIDALWPKYSTETTGDAAAPVMRVRVDNYKDRWIPRYAVPADPAHGIYNRPVEQSLHAALLKYLEKSSAATNVEAWSTEPSVRTGDKTEMKISLLQLLLLGAQDYHIARMLGLGAIDWQVNDTSHRYIYVAEYTATDPQYPDEAPTVHRYLSLPTGQTDSRLPVVPALKPLVTKLDPPFTDADGYTRFGTHRYIQLFRDELQFDLPVQEPFFSGPAGYSRGLQSRPILFGIRYASMTAQFGTPDWAIPDPSNDASDTAGPTYHPYIDNDGKAEVMPIPDLKPIEGEPVPALFTHRIARADEAGPWHRYALYGINWFSRVSPTVTYSPDFENNFPVHNTLQPPLNLRAQYLQYEDSPMLNAPSENNSTYFGKTRITFDWNHLHDIAYQFADRVEFFVRTDEPKRLRGKIVDVDMSEDEPPYAWITTDTYDEADGRTLVTIRPELAPGEEALYKGSMLVTPTNRFEILSVVRDTGNNNFARFRVKAIQQAGVDGSPNTGVPLAPIIGELFLVMENFSVIDEPPPGLPGWRRLGAHTMNLPQFTTHTEQITADGRSEDVQIGGLEHPAADVVRLTGDDVIGLYQVTMTGLALGTYTDYASKPLHLDVGFYKGTFRAHDRLHPEKARSLEVLKIIQTGPSLTLLVFDPEDRLLSDGATSPMWATFHPSYRLYIQWQAQESIDPAATFEPAAPELSRTTYIAAKAVHSARTEANGDLYRSSATPPTVHLARRVQIPQAPEEPLGPAYASRPDFYGKASYTFDTVLDESHIPYGMLFYRADEMALLMALYRLSTIADIAAHLPAHRSDDEFLEQRWQGLLQVTPDPGDNTRFKEYGGYRFPPPDKGLEQNYAGPYATDFNGQPKLNTIGDSIKEVLFNAFVPLTSSYVVLSDVTPSATLQTSPKKPVLHRSNGEPLDQSIAADLLLYDPYPMIRISEPGDPDIRLRFTDYTLDGASRNVYFYFTREVTTGLGGGPPSPVKGPVRLVNTFPPVAPAILKVQAQPESAVMGTKPVVLFRFNPPPAGERIRRIWIYRATSEADARGLRTMKQLPAIELNDDLPADQPFEVRDRFADLGTGEFIPYGQPIYYRVVVGRRIINEHEETEYVMSVPSETILVSIMDTVNPKAPAVDVQKQTVMGTGAHTGMVMKFTDVVLHWEQTAYNATYRLYKMSGQGQWTLITTCAPPHAPGTISYDWSGDPARSTQPDLIKLDDDDNVLYHRFKVVVTNSSGLVSIVDNVRII